MGAGRKSSRLYNNLLHCASNVRVRTLTKNACRGEAPENAHTVRRRILRMLGFEPGQIICPGSFYSQQYLDEILFPLYISV